MKRKEIKTFADLVGKKIVSATQKKLAGHDDTGYLELKFTDKTEAIIVASYGGYTGDSEDEYPTHISMADKLGTELEDIKSDKE